MLKIVEAFIMLTRNDCQITKEARHKFPGCKIARLKISPDKTTHLITYNEDVEDLYTAFQKKGIVSSRIGTNAIWAEGNSCSACHALALSGAVVLSSRAVSDDQIIYRVVAKSAGALEKIIKGLRDSGLEPSVTYHDFPKDLTDREREILYEVYVHGFFDQMRKSSLTDIAKNLGVSTATLSEGLRRTLRKIVRDYLEDMLLETIESQ